MSRGDGVSASVLEHLTTYYPTAPWLALLRAIEVERFRSAGRSYARPVLDLGCGDGFVASLALAPPIDVGVDIDSPALLRAVARGVYRVVITADARRLPFAPDTFRTVYCNGAMEHMGSLDSVLGEILRVMAPGGVLVTLVPSDRFQEPVGRVPRLLGKGMWDAFNRLHNHVNLLSPREWQERLWAHGLRTTHVEPYGGPAVAGYVATRDLCSKLHLAPRRPFFRLMHDGNLGRALRGCGKTAVRRLFAADTGAGSDGYWLMIFAEKH
jgi:SAM-dependent methyltransferase